AGCRSKPSTEIAAPAAVADLRKSLRVGVMSLHFIRGFRLVSIFCHAATGGRGEGGTGGVAMPVTIHFREVRFCCRATRRCRVTIHFREVTFVDGRNALLSFDSGGTDSRTVSQNVWRH